MLEAPIARSRRDWPGVWAHRPRRYVELGPDRQVLGDLHRLGHAQAELLHQIDHAGLAGVFRRSAPVE